MPGETLALTIPDRTSSYDTAYHSLEGRSAPNEDRAFSRALQGGRAVFGIADGVGGLDRGEVASEIAISSLQRFARSLEDGAPHVDLEAELCALYAEAGNAIKAQPTGGSMGTTLACGVVEGGRYIVANVGDTRIYHFDGSTLRQVTQDHSMLAEKLRAGVAVDLGSPQAKQWARALTRALGSGRIPDVDVFRGEFRASGELLLVVSDGVHGSVTEAQISQTLRAARSAEEAAEHLAHLAVDQNSTDNCSAAIVCAGGWTGGRGKLPQAGVEPSASKLNGRAHSPAQLLIAGLSAILIVLLVLALGLAAMKRNGAIAPDNLENAGTRRNVPEEELGQENPGENLRRPNKGSTGKRAVKPANNQRPPSSSPSRRRPQPQRTQAQRSLHHPQAPPPNRQPARNSQNVRPAPAPKIATPGPSEKDFK